MLESAKSDDPSLLPAASALASYDPDNGRWEAAGGKVSQALVSVNAIHLGSWIEALRPVRSALSAPLTIIFQDNDRPESERKLATNILSEYANDDPDRLAELLLVADKKAYVSLFPIAEKRAEQILPVFHAELAKKVTYTWDDPPLDPSWTTPDVGLRSRIESAQGVLAERFAFCQTLPIAEFLATAEALRKSGYRPVRFRPDADGQVERVAAVWTRDGRNWRISSGMTADELRLESDRNQKDLLLPVDVAGYMAIAKDGKPADRYAALWVEGTRDDEAQFYVGMTADEEDEVQGKLKEAKLIPRALHVMIGPERRTRYCGVWGRPTRVGITGQTYRDRFERNFEEDLAQLSDQVLLDVSVNGASKQQPTRERAQADLQRTDRRLKIKPDDLELRFARAMAYFQLGECQKAIEDFSAVIEKKPESVNSRLNRAIALARLGKKQDARSELEKFQNGNAPANLKLYLAAVSAAELGEGVDKAIETVEAAIGIQPGDADLLYNAACAFSLASRAISRSDKAKGRQLAERCLQLLREAIKNDDAVFGRMDEDADLDPIREEAAFVEIMKTGHPDRRYAAVWSSDASFEATSIRGLDPAAQLRKCRELIAQGFRPVSWSASQTTTEGPLVTASVWHRPVITEVTRDRLAERQARAAVALVRMGDAVRVWPLLRHGPDPRLRSFIVNWLNPLGADPKLTAAELDRLDSPAKRHPPLATREMDAILFHPETSVRRALILALGTYGVEGSSLSGREPLIGKLLDLYRNDPDSGIHGAVEWTLRQWMQQEKLKELDAELMKVADWADRRWFVNSQGQTFAVVEGPVEFRMGSPPTETERSTEGSETPRHTRIPRRFAIAAKEVTVEQFERFLKFGGITNARYRVSASILSRYSPDLQGPWIEPDWYMAAHYCNWLSEHVGLPKDQWCYLPTESGAYAEGMSIPANVLERTGYRLPTTAEWEYACRAGAVTSRFYGHTIDLLDAYARYQANSEEHAWTCGSLISNDLGLFDMLGNVNEWCQELYVPKAGKKGIHCDILLKSESITSKDPRPLRGGTFKDLPALIRPAESLVETPYFRLTDGGFRLAKTQH